MLKQTKKINNKRVSRSMAILVHSIVCKKNSFLTTTNLSKNLLNHVANTKLWIDSESVET